MSKKKVAGIDRPYTVNEIGKILCEYVKDGDFENKACLDYYIADYDDETEITKEFFDIISVTRMGGSEGIYTSFYLDYRDERIKVMTAKTLGETEDDFVNMHEMGARVCYRFDKFVGDNITRFVWYGQGVSFVGEDGKENTYVYTNGMDRVARFANEILENHPGAKVYYTDMYTRKKYEYNL